MAKSKTDTVLKRVYPVILAIAMFTGFGNMPIYKRYYISAVPGLGWSGNFYFNLNVHYIAAALLLGIAVYFTLTYLKIRTTGGRLTASGILRAVILGLSLLSGIMLATRNLSAVNFVFGTQMAVAFTHLGAAMILLVISVVCGLSRRSWMHKR